MFGHCWFCRPEVQPAEIVEEPILGVASLPSEIDNSKPRALFVSDNLPLHELLIQAAKSSTIVIPVNYADWSLSQLIQATVLRLGSPAQQLASIGLIDHGRRGEFCLLKSVGAADGMVSLETVKANGELQDFFKLLAKYIHKVETLDSTDFRKNLFSRIDLMACDLAEGDGIKLIDYLEEITQINWAASTNHTGNPTTAGCDWDMETDKGLGPVNRCYFEDEKLKKWAYHANADGWFDNVPILGHISAVVSTIQGDDEHAQKAWEGANGTSINIGVGIGVGVGAATAIALTGGAAAAPIAAGVAAAAAGGVAGSVAENVYHADPDKTASDWVYEATVGGAVGGLTGGIGAAVAGPATQLGSKLAYGEAKSVAYLLDKTIATPTLLQAAAHDATRIIATQVVTKPVGFAAQEVAMKAGR